MTWAAHLVEGLHRLRVTDARRAFFRRHPLIAFVAVALLAIVGAMVLAAWVLVVMALVSRP